MNKHELPLEVVAFLESERKIILDQILKENISVKINLGDFGTFSIEYILDSHFMVLLELDAKFVARVNFHQLIENNYGDQSYIQIMPIKKYVPQSVLNLGRYRDGSYLLNLDNSISEPFISAIKLLVTEKRSLIQMCHASSCYDCNGKLKKKFKSWRTEAILLSIKKEMPLVHMVTGISKSQQAHYDALPGVHGSNGTYVENANPYWVLTYRVKRLAFEVDQSVNLTIDVHDYITNELMPNLGWERISENRLNHLNKCIKGTRTSVITHDMEEAPIFRSFYPENSKDSWNEFLNDCFRELF